MPNSGFFATHFKAIALPFHKVMQNPGGIVVKPPTHTGIGVIDQPSGGIGAGPSLPVVTPSATPTQAPRSGIFGGALSNLFRVNQE